MMRVLLSVTMLCLAHSLPTPDHPSGGGFQPVHGSRGGGPGSGYSAPPSPSYSGPGGSGGFGHGGVGSHPTKTIYVNVPHPEPPQPLPPVAAGPPRKHYKIVFIRAPPPPPAAQPILPPRTEQKTLIYVLHQRPEIQEQQVIQVPSVKHNPEVFFVQYDNPPTAEELQQLSAGDLSGFTVTSQASGGGGGGYGGGDSLPLGSSREDLAAPLGGGAPGGLIGVGGVPLPLVSGSNIPSEALRVARGSDNVPGLASLEAQDSSSRSGTSVQRT